MVELADRRLVWRRLIAKIDADEIPHRCAVIEAVLGLRVRHVEPLLKKVDAYHPFNSNRRAASFPRGVMRLNQPRERGPRNHGIHLRQEALPTRLLVGATKAEVGEAFLPQGGHAQRLKGRCETETENQ